jgi:hypothetical protein
VKEAGFQIELGDAWKPAQGLYVVRCSSLFRNILRWRGEWIWERIKGNVVANKPHGCRWEMCLMPCSPAIKHQKIY